MQTMPNQELRHANSEFGSSIALSPEVHTVHLPLGLVDRKGHRYGDVLIRPLSGHEQRLLAGITPLAPIAEITTALLTRCVLRVGSIAPVSQETVREFLIGDREFLLLKIYEVTFGERLLVPLSCPFEACREPLELPLLLSKYSVEAPPATSRTFRFERQNRALHFRLPTGRDQEWFARSASNDIRDGLKHLAEPEKAVQVDTAIDSLSVDEVALIEKRLHELAPPIEVEIEANCPSCRNTFQSEIDIPFAILAEIKTTEAEVDWDVHFLASHYHWPESELLAMTPRRRRRYIELLQAELERAGV